VSENETIEQLLAQLQEARKDLDEKTAEEQSARNRHVDARNVYNGITKKIDVAMRKLREGYPQDSDWRNGQREGGAA